MKIKKYISNIRTNRANYKVYINSKKVTDLRRNLKNDMISKLKSKKFVASVSMFLCMIFSIKFVSAILNQYGYTEQAIKTIATIYVVIFIIIISILMIYLTYFLTDILLFILQPKITFIFDNRRKKKERVKNESLFNFIQRTKTLSPYEISNIIELKINLNATFSNKVLFNSIIKSNEDYQKIIYISNKVRENFSKEKLFIFKSHLKASEGKLERIYGKSLPKFFSTIASGSFILACYKFLKDEKIFEKGIDLSLESLSNAFPILYILSLALIIVVGTTKIYSADKKARQTILLIIDLALTCHTNTTNS